MIENDVPEEHYIVDALSKFEFLSALSTATLEEFAAVTDDLTYGCGDTILASGQDDGATLFAVADGVVRRTRGIAALGEIDVHLLESSTLFDLTALALGGHQIDPTLELVAHTECRVLMIDMQVVSEKLGQSLSIQQDLLRALAQDVRRLERSDRGAPSPERRIYQHLLALMKPQGRSLVIDPMPRHKVLAEAAGVQERTAAEALAVLMRERIISRQFPVAIVEDPERLRAYAR